MKVVTSLAFALAATLGASAFAADKAPADQLTPQQQKMSGCAKDAHAKNLKGDEYKTFMGTCMKGSDTAAGKTAAATTPSPPTNMTPAGDVATSTTSADKTQAAEKKTPAKTGDQQWVAVPSSLNPQQQKMKACATDAKAKGLKGTDRRTYMSTCLKADQSTPAATTTPAKTATPAKKSTS